MPWNNGSNGPGNSSGGPGNPGGGNQGGGGGPWGGGTGGSRPPGGEKPTPPPGGGKRPPSGGGGGGFGGGKPPELDELLRRGQFHFNRLFSGGPAQQNLIGIAVAIIGSLWLLSGFYRIQPDEQGIPKIFGRANPNNIVDPGLHYVWPAPIGSVLKPRTGSENRIEIPETIVDQRLGSMGNESLMLTNDQNIINIKFVVLWKIKDPFRYEFDIRDQEHTITRAAESAIREVVADTPIQAALTEGRAQVGAQTKKLLQTMLDEYGAGVTIDDINLTEVSPPDPVRESFNDVQRAISDADRARNEAQSYKNSIIPRARGEATGIENEAKAYSYNVINGANGDADRFKAVYQSYAAAKDVTQKRMYLEMMEEILKNARKIVTDTPAGTPVVLPYAPPAEPAPTTAPAASTGGQR